MAHFGESGFGEQMERLEDEDFARAARQNAVRQWTDHPCGAVAGDEQALEYFLEVERLRYEAQPWQRPLFRFERSAGQRVLEIGVGIGTDLVQFAKAGADCHGVDITDRHLELTARNFALRGLSVDLKRCDATRIDHPNESFDVVYSFGVIHHVPDATAVVREIERVLKPGGRCLVALYHKGSFFHLYMVLVRGLLLGRLFRLGYDGLMSTVEAGADGVRTKPYVKLYSRREVRALFSSFQVHRITVRHVEIGRSRDRLVGRLVSPLLRALESVLGWYVICDATRR
jgi:ubiquinone/menaquinone biosynthesis C-methylase UbiE